MDDRMIEKNDEIEIDLQRIWNALLNKAWLIGIVAIVCAVVTLVGTVLFVTPMYQSSIMLYVNNSSAVEGGTSDSISTSDISASRAMVKAYVIILKTKETLERVVDCAGVDYTYGQVKGMISAESVNSTEIIRIVVTNANPQDAEKIANAIATVLPTQINSIIDGTSARIVETASLATSPSSPSYLKNTVFGFAIGFMAVAILVVLQSIFDTTVRNETDATLKGTKPMLATVPDMLASSKGGYYYGYGKKKYDTTRPHPTDKKVLLGNGISFAASEAYKLLRTKVLFSFADDYECHIIGVSSAMTGEGKSLTSANLAYSMSQLSKRVLLIDCDMRRPSIADKLPVQKYPGLSEYLSSQTGAENLIQFCGIAEDERAFHVISAGRVPPNPMELLSSNKMAKMLEQLRGKYDYIILDLPPVGEVGDALAVAKLTDGMLLVVRQDYCNRLALNATVRQFEFVESKILGVVLNCAAEETAGYGRKYYKRYGNKYYKRYGYYSASDRRNK